ncbi:MAG: peptidylprolyl isomerase [Kiritimatiellae bacterium]|nr:peptidylprolyl isomerase [Kiritimatiellia bacterium]
MNVWNRIGMVAFAWIVMLAGSGVCADAAPAAAPTAPAVAAPAAAPAAQAEAGVNTNRLGVAPPSMLKSKTGGEVIGPNRRPKRPRRKLTKAQRELIEDDRALASMAPGAVVIRVGDETISMGALSEMAELQLRSRKMPAVEISPEEFETMMRQLISRRMIELGNRFAAHSMLAQEAKRQGVAVPDVEINRKRAEAYEAMEKNGKQAWMQIYKKPGSYFEHELTNSLYLAKFREKKIVPSVRVTEADVKKAIADRVATNEWFLVYNAKQKLLMEEHRAKILSGEEDFAKVADDFSNCDSSMDEGVWGTFTEENLPAELWKVAVSLPLNTLGPVVETPVSYDMMKVTKRNYPIGVKPDAEGVRPVSYNISHIMRDKKLPLPLLTPETARDLVQKTREREAMIEVEKRLRETVEVESFLPLKVGIRKRPPLPKPAPKAVPQAAPKAEEAAKADASAPGAAVEQAEKK